MQRGNHTPLRDTVPNANSVGAGMTTHATWEIPLVARNDGDRIYIRRIWTLTREAALAMVKARNEWQAQSDALNAWLDKMDVTDKKARADIRGQNLDLQGAYNAWQFWQGQVVGYAAALQVEQLAPALLGIDSRDSWGPPSTLEQ